MIAREIVDIAYPPAQRPAMFANVMQNILAQMKASILPRVSDQGLQALLVGKIDGIPDRLAPITNRHIPAFMESYARAYAREFTPDELRQLLAFVSTPAGGHYASRAAYLLGDPDVAAANRAYFADVQVVQTTLATEIGRDVAAYVEKHPNSTIK